VAGVEYEGIRGGGVCGVGGGREDETSGGVDNAEENAIGGDVPYVRDADGVEAVDVDL
jgi:hypothetical protein